ncbi:MAG: amino acid ABC transporter permease [Calditerrivibrio sp.]|uniref:amino acid ABC transporter permease n=1 Tax=Calditerrivibrio sp. TaxID=2792612 RepID=UPI003D0AB27C
MKLIRNRYLPVDIFISILVVSLFLFLIKKISTEIDYQFNWNDLVKFFFYYDDRLKIGLITNGIIYTVKISIFVLILSFITGLITGFIISSTKGVIKELFKLYMVVLRNIPPLIVMFIFYFFIGSSFAKVLNLDTIFSNRLFALILTAIFTPEQIFVPFISAAMGLAFYESAYIAEIIRGGINGIEKGQIDAGTALGLNRIEVYLYIVVPQAIEKTLPSLIGQFVSIIKNTAIASVVAIPELTFQAMEILASSRLILEIWIIIFLIYLVINLFISYLASMVESRIRRKYK